MNSDEAAIVQEAARRINEQVSALKSLYTTQDDLNIALMCCLKVATDHVRFERDTEAQTQAAMALVAGMEARLEQRPDGA